MNYRGGLVWNLYLSLSHYMNYRGRSGLEPVLVIVTLHGLQGYNRLVYEEVQYSLVRSLTSSLTHSLNHSLTLCLSVSLFLCLSIYISIYLVCSRYITVGFFGINHKRHAIAHPEGWGMGCCL